MKKIIFTILFSMVLIESVSAKPNYVELICAPDRQWEGGFASKSERVWFPSFKPKFLIHMDLEKMKVVKIGYSKNEDEIRDVEISMEKKSIDERIEYQFIKSGSLRESLNVFNIITVLYSDVLIGLFVTQYQLNSEKTNLIINEMKNDTVSEFERARDLYTKKTGAFIPYNGGMSAVECKSVRKYK